MPAEAVSAGGQWYGVMVFVKICNAPPSARPRAASPIWGLEVHRRHRVARRAGDHVRLRCAPDPARRLPAVSRGAMNPSSAAPSTSRKRAPTTSPTMSSRVTSPRSTASGRRASRSVVPMCATARTRASAAPRRRRSTAPWACRRPTWTSSPMTTAPFTRRHQPHRGGRHHHRLRVRPFCRGRRSAGSRWRPS